jgi:hypothetical protein
MPNVRTLRTKRDLLTLCGNPVQPPLIIRAAIVDDRLRRALALLDDHGLTLRPFSWVEGWHD